MRLAFTVGRTPQGRSDLLVSADPRTPLRNLIPGGGIPARLFVAGSQVSTAVSLADAGLRGRRSDRRVRAVTAGCPVRGPRKAALLVASGPATGASFTIPARGLTVGRSTLPILGDDEISGRHFHVRSVAGGSVSVADAGSTNGTVVSGEPLDGERGLVPGDLYPGRPYRVHRGDRSERRRGSFPGRGRTVLVQPGATARGSTRAPGSRCRTRRRSRISAVPRS